MIVTFTDDVKKVGEGFSSKKVDMDICLFQKEGGEKYISFFLLYQGKCIFCYDVLLRDENELSEDEKRTISHFHYKRFLIDFHRYMNEVEILSKRKWLYDSFYDLIHLTSFRRKFVEELSLPSERVEWAFMLSSFLMSTVEEDEGNSLLNNGWEMVNYLR